MNLHLPLKTFVAGVRDKREEGYRVGGLSLSLMEPLVSISSMESFFSCNFHKEPIQRPRMKQSFCKLTLVWKGKGLSIGALK